MTTLYRLVTLAEAKEHLSILDAEDDARVDRLVIDASQKVMGYVNWQLDDWTDTAGLPLVYANGDPQRVGATGTLDTAGNFQFDVDTNGDPINAGISIIPSPVRLGTLVLIGRLDDDREGKEDPFNDAVKSLLSDYRKPVFA